MTTEREAPRQLNTTRIAATAYITAPPEICAIQSDTPPMMNKGPTRPSSVRSRTTTSVRPPGSGNVDTSPRGVDGLNVDPVLGCRKGSPFREFVFGGAA